MKRDLKDPQVFSACDQSRRLVLDLSLSAETRNQLAESLAHIRECEACRSAVQDYDQIGQLLTPAADLADEESIVDQWVEPAIRELPSTLRTFSWRPFSWRPAVARMSIAAGFAAVMALGGYWIGHRSGPMAVALTSVAMPIAPADVSNRVRAFEQVTKAFDNRADWLLVSDSGSDVGLDPAPTTDTGMLLIRLTVTRRNNPGDLTTKAAVVSSADLAILPGRTARLSLPFPQGRVLSYEVSAGTGDPTRLGLLAALLPADHSKDLTGTAEQKPLAALSTTVDMYPGGASPAGSFVTGTAGYELTVGFSKAQLSAEGQP